MNHKFVNTSVVKAIAIVSATALLAAGSPSSSFAGGVKEKAPTHMSDEQVSVKYVGTKNNAFVFHVQFDNPTADKFSIILKNDAGVVVYQEQFTDAHFSRNFQLPNEEGEIYPTFIIRSGNKKVERSFAVNTKLTESVEVTKL